MKLPIIKESYFVNAVILVFSLFISWFGLLFGLAHLVEGRHPDTPMNEHLLGVAFCVALVIIGLAFGLLALACVRGMIYRYKTSRGQVKD